MLTYAGIPSQIPAPVVSVISGSLTTPVSGSLYWQMRNRQGFNLYSPPTAINLTTGQGVTVIVPNCNCEGYDPVSYVLSFSPTNTYLAAYVIATYSASDTLPGTLTLNKNEYFVTQKSVANTSQIPVNKIDGMRVYVDGWGEIREWQDSQWLRVYPQEFQTLVTSTRSVNGCDRLLSEFTDEQKEIIIRPDYAVDRSYSEPVKFWLRNETTSPYFAGRSISVGISWGDTDLTDLFFGAGAVNLTFLGYVKLTDGSLDTSASGGGEMTGINQRITYTNNNSGLILEKDLLSGYAYLIAVEIQVDVASLGGRVAENAQIEVSLSIGERVGYYSGVAAIIGNLISAGLDLRRIVPDTGLSAIALSGSGIVNGRSFIGVGERGVFGLVANTANQIVAINGNGTCFAVSQLGSGQILRAKVGTLNGCGKAIVAGNVALSPSTQLQIELTHPTNIRSDYLDVIAGNSKGNFNATDIWIWIGGNKFTTPVQLGEATQTITLTGSGGVATTVPVSELGLYSPVIDSVTAISGASGFANGSYLITVAYYYTNTVTSISHQGILEMDSDILSFIENSAKKYALVFG